MDGKQLYFLQEMKAKREIGDHEELQGKLGIKVILARRVNQENLDLRELLENQVSQGNLVQLVKRVIQVRMVHQVLKVKLV